MAETSTTVRSFYSALASGDTELAKSLMADGIEWINVLPWDQPDKDDLELLSSFIARTLAERYSKGWTFQLKRRGLIDVTRCIIFPFLEEGASFAPSPIPFREESGKVVWLGTLTTIDGPTGERKDFAFAHAWDVEDCRIKRVRQLIYFPTPIQGWLQ